MYHPSLSSVSPADANDNSELVQRIYELGSDAETHVVTKSAAAPRIYDGMTSCDKRDVGRIEYCRDIILTDDEGEVLLQRFGPSSLAEERRMMKQAGKGRPLLDALHKKSCAQPSDWAYKPECLWDNAEYEFGAVYLDDEPYLSWPTVQRYKDRDERSNKAGRKAVADFCVWFSDYAQEFVSPLVSEKCFRFPSQMVERKASHFPWTTAQVPGLDDICASLYSTFTASKGFPPRPRKREGAKGKGKAKARAMSNRNEQEEEDDVLASPSILINFGQHALLKLTEYNCSIALQPLDIVVFSFSSYYTKLEAVQHPLQTTNPEGRWSVLAYFLRAFQQRLLPDDDILAMIKEARKRQGQSSGVRPRIKLEEDDEDQAMGTIDADSAQDSSIQQDDADTDAEEDELGDHRDCGDEDIVHLGTRRSKRKRTSRR
ncbi:hypothetical protein PHSY_003120 [Pseudozyma hubeiensis SY62]|uniref:Uncharacterized protein n=1 Tax=Pseudozyma hubeiensis (strain SY62) TaxID=1305764 RepID=R9P2P2_PSEHS|nr:hypothetical protein PHSY_003120 [Pseudozyma hubeiensis SY62]GAC95544.1 hypothetical protein PHSY_003120 [Pseudozyma hubeiensis SY62]